ncbi:MAG: PPC domain-containing DNA-binding protein [Endomicrobiales bacterium]
MKYSEAKYGRVFVIRLEDGETVHEAIENFAREKGVRAGMLVVLGGADEGSKLVVGPEEGRGVPVIPLEHTLYGVHEVMGTGTIFPDAKGEPVLHLHIACGRYAATATGCAFKGVKVWHMMEVVLLELLDTGAVRALDPATGFELLEP